MKRTMISLLVVAAVITIFAAAASARSKPEAGDPSPSSPSSAVYQIPLDNGRADAAPRKRNSAAGGQGASGGSGGPGGGGGTPSRTGHSTGPESAAGDQGSSGSAAAVPTSTSGSTIHSKNGFGSSTQVPATLMAGHGTTGKGGSTAVVPVPSSTEKSGGPTVGTWLLIALIGGFGTYFGVTASRSLRRR